MPNTARLKALGLDNYDIRSMLIADKGRSFIISDYEGIELVILAWMSGDENLLHQIELGDVHSYVANALFAEETKRVLGEYINKDNRKKGKWKVVRDEFKRVSYAICYGSTGWNIFRTCSIPLASVGIHITQEDAEEWVHRWKTELFPKTGVLFDRNASKAVTQYYTESVLGRKRYWEPAVVRSSKSKFFAAQREGMNQPIQATSADMTKLAMSTLFKTLNLKKARIVACIHDELLIESDDDYVDTAAALTKSAMEEAGEYLLQNIKHGLVKAEPKISKCYDK